jgi:hypothetical protein
MEKNIEMADETLKADEDIIKYLKKRENVIYISLDHKKEDWINAINKHEIEWPNLSDLHGMPSDLSNTYSIPGIPFGLLINKKGIIVTTVHGVHVLDFILDKIAK